MFSHLSYFIYFRLENALSTSALYVICNSANTATLAACSKQSIDQTKCSQTLLRLHPGIFTQSHSFVKVPYSDPDFNHVFSPGANAPRCVEN